MPAMAIPRKVRKNRRAQVSLVARYRSPTAFEYVEEECHDLSLGGMFIRSVAPAPAGTLIKLECDIGGGSRTIRGVARVVWLRDSSGDGQPAGMGVKFIKLDPGARDAIKAILDELVESDADRDSEAPERIESQRVRRESQGAPPGPADPLSSEAQATAEQPASLSDDEALEPTSDDEFSARLESEAATVAPRVHRQRPTAPRPDFDPEPRRRASSGVLHSQAFKYAMVGTVLAGIGLASVWGGRDPTPMSTESAGSGKPATLAAPAAPPAPSAPAALPGPSAPAPVPVDPAALAAQASPPTAKYLLDLITNPAGADIAVGNHHWTSPARVELPGLPAEVELEISKPGFERMTLHVDARGFTLEEGEWRRRLVLSLTPAKQTARTKRVRTRVEAPAESPLQAASRCLARGDNRCVIRSLEGRARTPRELEMLVETYRATGNLQKAQQSMRAYVAKYPTGDRAVGYRQLLEHQGNEPSRRTGQPRR